MKTYTEEEKLSLLQQYLKSGLSKKCIQPQP